MIKRYLSFVLITLLVTSPAAFAAGDPMKSLFLFQQKMAKKGNTSAMMKMGEMYERGEGVAKSNENALKMYEQAKAGGNPKADTAIQRLKKITSNKSSNNSKRAAQEKARQRELAAEKQRKEREAAAKRKAANDAAKAKLAADNAAKAKAEREAKEKAAKEAKANAAKAKAAKEAKAKVAREAKAKAAKAKAAREAKAKAAKEAQARAKAKAARLAAEKKRKEAQATQEGFKSDPCKGKAARFSSLCK